MDMMQTAQLLGFDTNSVGFTNDYEKTANSDVVVITSGIPRKPGMTREELIGVNGMLPPVVCDRMQYFPSREHVRHHDLWSQRRRTNR